jgi:hypothetical protein
LWSKIACWTASTNAADVIRSKFEARLVPYGA